MSSNLIIYFPFYIGKFSGNHFLFFLKNLFFLNFFWNWRAFDYIHHLLYHTSNPAISNPNEAFRINLGKKVSCSNLMWSHPPIPVLSITSWKVKWKSGRVKLRAWCGFFISFFSSSTSTSYNEQVTSQVSRWVVLSEIRQSQERQEKNSEEIGRRKKKHHVSGLEWQPS